MNQARNSPVGFYVSVTHVPYLEVNRTVSLCHVESKRPIHENNEY